MSNPRLNPFSISFEQQYIQSIHDVLDYGVRIPNERTGIDCIQLINQDFYIDAASDDFPLLTIRKVGIKRMFAELLGYFKQFTSAAQFRALGTPNWDANANETKAWLANPNRKGEDDIGLVYGAVAANWPKHDGTTIDLFRRVYDNLKKGIDDRGLIVTYWNPGLFELGALRPCMHGFQFSLEQGVLHLHPTQRSNDSLLGCVSNIPQCYMFLRLMAQITGHEPGRVYHRSVNYHVYANQLDVLHESGMLERQPYNPPKLWINPEIRTWDDVVNWVTPDDFKLLDYTSHPAVVFPMAS